MPQSSPPSTPLTIACINLERSKHLPLVETFLKANKPDVLCLQELCQRDIPFFESLIGGPLVFAPMALIPAESEHEPIGIGIVSRHKLDNTCQHYYHGSPAAIQPARVKRVMGKTISDPDSVANVLLSVTCGAFQIATTHLAVTPDGKSTAWQRAIAARLILAAQGQATSQLGLLLAGDFNAPRGRATFDMLAAAFTDAIPPEYTTSIDGSLHRAGHLENRMVDAFFHTPNYRMANVVLHTGVSDHCALTGTLSYS